MLCLRLGVIECHARGRIGPQALTLRRQQGQALIEVDADWSQAHPRTLYLLQEEVQAWQRGGILTLELRG